MTLIIDDQTAFIDKIVERDGTTTIYSNVSPNISQSTGPRSPRLVKDEAASLLARAVRKHRGVDVSIAP